MTIKVSDVMRHVRNYFVRGALKREWSHQGGLLVPIEMYEPGAWIAITGPEAPCGVYQLDENGGIPDMGDITWTGTIYQLNPPADFLRLCGDINCWAAANPDPSASSEKLGEYSVIRKYTTWQEAFAPALAPYRRMFAEVIL